MLVFVEGGKPENRTKNPQSKARINYKLNPHMAPCQNRTRDIMVGGERYNHCAIPAHIQMAKSTELAPSFTFLHFVVVKVCDRRTRTRGNNTFLGMF